MRACTDSLRETRERTKISDSVRDDPPSYWILLHFIRMNRAVLYQSTTDVTRGLQSHSEKTLSLYNSNLQ